MLPTGRPLTVRKGSYVGKVSKKTDLCGVIRYESLLAQVLFRKLDWSGTGRLGTKELCTFLILIGKPLLTREMRFRAIFDLYADDVSL